jgi:hypothetical protein
MRDLRSKSLIAQSTGTGNVDDALRRNLLKFRAVIVLITTPYGEREAVVAALRAELAVAGIGASVGSIYNWRQRVLYRGVAGLARGVRGDKGNLRQRAALPLIVEAATRVRRFGDLAREFRKLQPGISYETWRRWIRTLQRHVGVTEIR